MRRSVVLLLAVAAPGLARAEPPRPSTFSIVAADSAAGEVGVAVASRFFSVGSVVPWVRAGAGAVATQANANTTYGARGLELLASGLTPDEVVSVLTRGDAGRESRQIGVVAADGRSATYSGPGCNAWAGGRRGPSYAVQGNILTGEPVVAAMEKGFLDSAGQPLALRLVAALRAGEAAGGDSRGKQSAALVVARDKGGYNGFTDRAIDVRVDDSPDPLPELARLADLALVNDLWNRGWTAFTEKRYADALLFQTETARRAEKAAIFPEVLYDLAVIQVANGEADAGLETLKRAVALNPKLAHQARVDKDLDAVRARVEAALPKER
jgi:uncharacterized Ntn-hydrolase superfamily protein